MLESNKLCAIWVVKVVMMWNKSRDFGVRGLNPRQRYSWSDNFEVSAYDSNERDSEREGLYRNVPDYRNKEIHLKISKTKL
jgi:hypothetical protein